VNPVPSVPIFKNPQTVADIQSGVPTIAFMPVYNDLLPPGTVQPPNVIDNVRANATVLPWDISGTFLAGLNPQGTFQVTVKYFVEKVPTLSDPNLLVLAKTPTPYDGNIIEIYARVTQELPVAVPVGENPLGEWFETVMSVIGDVLPVVGKSLSFIPGAALVGEGLGAGAKHLASMNKTERLNQNQPSTNKLAQSQTIALAQNGNQTSQVKRPPKPLPKRPVKKS